MSDQEKQLSAEQLSSINDTVEQVRKQLESTIVEDDDSDDESVSEDESVHTEDLSESSQASEVSDEQLQKELEEDKQIEEAEEATIKAEAAKVDAAPVRDVDDPVLTFANANFAFLEALRDEVIVKLRAADIKGLPTKKKNSILKRLERQQSSHEALEDFAECIYTMLTERY